MKKIVTPHDAVFKSALSDVRVARDFFENYLPEKIKSLVDLSSLTIENGSFIDDELKKSYTDILYRVQFFKKTKEINYFYLLVEHQSTPDYWLPLRILRYLCRILEQYRKQNPEKCELPLVIPLIFYTDKGIYPYSTDLMTLFGAQRDLAQELLFGPYRLIELNRIPDGTIQQHRWVGLLEMVLKHVRYRDSIDLFKELAHCFILPLLIEQQEDIDNYLLSLLNYALSQADVKDVDAFIRAVQVDLPTPMEEKLMSIAQKLERRGEQRGEQRGLEKGRHQGEVLLMIQQLQYRFGTIPPFYLKKIESANEETLFDFSRKILDAKSLEEVFV